MPKVVVDEQFHRKARKLLARHPDKKKRIAKALRQLEADPRHPSLQTKRYDESQGIWQSYVEHNTPGAWRVWWLWSSEEPDTIVVLEYGPHPS